MIALFVSRNWVNLSLLFSGVFFLLCKCVLFYSFLVFFQYERNYIALQKKTPKMHCSGLSLAATIKTATQFKIHHNSRNSKTDKAFKLCEHTFKRISVSKKKPHCGRRIWISMVHINFW